MVLLLLIASCLASLTPLYAQVEVVFETDFQDTQMTSDGNFYDFTNNNWTSAFPNYTLLTETVNGTKNFGVGEARIQTGGIGTFINEDLQADMGAIIVEGFPATPENKALKFQIEDYYDNNGDLVGRVQNTIHFEHSAWNNCTYNGLRNFHYSVDLLLQEEDFGWLVDDNTTEVSFLTIAELFNNANFAPSAPVGLPDNDSEDFQFRISLKLEKKIGEEFFHFQAKGEPREVDGSGWGDPIWLQESEATIGIDGNDGTTFNLDQWLTLDVFFIEGDNQTGKFVLKVNDIPVIDITNFTRHPDEVAEGACNADGNPSVGPNGVKHIQPMKLYTNDVLVNAFNTAGKNLQVFWDNFSMETNFDIHEHDIICPISAGCATLNDTNGDAEQSGLGATVELDNDDLDFHSQYVGLQFSGLSVPPHATIVDAHIQLESKIEGNTGTTMVTTTIYAEDIFPAPNPFSDLNDLVTRTEVMNPNTFEWNILPWEDANARTYYQRTPNLNDEIERMIPDNDPQISPNDILSFVFAPNNVGNRTGKRFEDGAPDLCVLYDFLASGNIAMWCGDQIPIPGVQVDIAADGNGDPCGLGNADFYDAVTDPLGNFRQHICDIVATYELTPEKADGLGCGLDAIDLTLISQHALSVQTTSLAEGHVRIAADANSSNTIEKHDVFVVHREILGNPIYEIPNYRPWKFHDGTELAETGDFGPAPPYNSTIERSLPGEDNQVNFEAIKVGDVDCSCLYEDLIQLTGEVVVIIEDIDAVKDEIFDVRFRVENFVDIKAYQLGIDFDTEKLEYLGTAEADLSEGGDPNNFGTTDATSGKIRHLWLQNDASDPSDLVVDTTLADQSSLFVMTFKAKEDVTSLRESAKLSDLIQLSNKVLANMAVGKDEVHPITLKFAPKGSFDDVKNGHSLIQNIHCYPNPTSSSITFEVALFSSTMLQLEVFDPTGRQLVQQEQQLDYGIHQIQIDEVKNWQEGLYFYTITAADGKEWSGKFVKQ